MTKAHNNDEDCGKLAERLTKNEEKTHFLGKKVLSLEATTDKHNKKINEHTTDLKVHKVELDNKFEKSITHSKSLEKSINSLKEVVDSVVPVLNNMISSKAGADKAKEKMTKTVVTTVAVCGTICGIFVAIVKLTS